jgi:phosphate transport system substrate-binding protein
MKAKSLIISAIIALIFFGANLAMAGNLVITGSTTVLPVAQKVAEAYMAQNPNVKISISGGGSGEGIKALIDGTTNIADSSRFIKDSEIKQAVDKGRYPVPFAVAYDCIVPVVHPSNSIVNLTVQQLKGIYKGDIKNWKEIGGPDKKIVIISRDTSSGTYEVWEEKIMNKERITPAALLQASNGAIVQAVSSNPNAIGYVGIGYLDSSVKALMVDRVKASAETALNGTFPIHRALYMFTNGWPKGDTLDFLNFLLHPQKGQKYVKDEGFVPLY